MCNNKCINVWVHKSVIIYKCTDYFLDQMAHYLLCRVRLLQKICPTWPSSGSADFVCLCLFNNLNWSHGKSASYMFICQVLFKKRTCAWLLASFNMWLLFAVPLSEGGGLCHMSFLSECDHGTTCMLCFCFTSPDPPSDSFNYRYTFSYVWSFSIFCQIQKHVAQSVNWLIVLCLQVELMLIVSLLLQVHPFPI